MFVLSCSKTRNVEEKKRRRNENIISSVYAYTANGGKRRDEIRPEKKKYQTRKEVIVFYKMNDAFR